MYWAAKVNYETALCNTFASILVPMQRNKKVRMPKLGAFKVCYQIFGRFSDLRESKIIYKVDTKFSRRHCDKFVNNVTRNAKKSGIVTYQLT